MMASLRKAYGEALVASGAKDRSIVVLDADLCKSTMSVFFEKAFPERFIEAGIAEQNMTSMAAGLAIAGKKPFINTFAMFDTGRNYDQIRQSICIPCLQVMICGSSCGLSDFADGSTHQALEDVALMRVLPNMTVLVPADATETGKIVEAALTAGGPVYIRINRSDMPQITDPGKPFVIGQPYVLREGCDYAVFACGVMVHKALEAAVLLAEEGISVRVVNVPTIKPLDVQSVRELAAEVKGIVVAEEHSKYGGLYSTICELLAGTGGVRIRYVAVEDVFGTSAHKYDELMEHYGLTAENIVKQIRSFNG